MNTKVVSAMTAITKTLADNDNEGTRAPYWIIIDPFQNMSCDIHVAANQFTGIFFSRKDAEEYLKATKHHYSDRVRVYCHSGHYSHKYEALCDALKI